jgi:hypothetical protein
MPDLRSRLRALGFDPELLPFILATGKRNDITDVVGVQVGTFANPGFTQRPTYAIISGCNRGDGRSNLQFYAKCCNDERLPGRIVEALPVDRIRLFMARYNK